ncbi:MAG: RidA family protein [Anaerolineaceae bacterium]|nr:RidA family protein [Anaerolineaceae bacterium]MCY3908361.1 RidA family protein [Anaerolineaceae bacterium]
MSRTIISAPDAPAALGPYSHAVSANGFVFTAGQVGILPGSGALAEGGVEAQTRQVMENISAVLLAAGTGFDRVVKTTIFLASMDDFATVNGIYAQYFPQDPPARSTVAVAGLPLGALVEIETVALV